jgi:plastocyanin
MVSYPLECSRMKPSVATIFALALLSTAAAAKEVQVSIASLKFSPASVTVSPGDTVVWTNDDDRGHTVVSDDGSFSSGEIGQGAKFHQQFAKAGEFTYHCDHHSRMRGKVVVKVK